MRQKVNFYIPEGITGHQFEKFLKRSHLHFFHPKRKDTLHPDSEKIRQAICTEINTKEINKKIKEGKLRRI
jgi:hypothetical protein